MQKILHVVEPLGTGIYTFLAELTRYQCEKYEVYVAYGVRPFTPKNFRECFDGRVHWIRVRNFQRTIGIKDIKAFFELKRIFRKVRPDIVHLHSSKAGFLGRWAFDCSKYKVFYTPNGFSFLMERKSGLSKLLYRSLEYVSAQRKAITVACGKGEYEEALKLSSRCIYVNNGINICKLLPLLTENNPKNPLPVVCTSGRISRQKNPKLFNDIAHLLPQARFIWIGDGEMREELTATNVEVTGWLARTEALNILATTDFFLLSSLWEGLPLSLLEAMYLRKVCLVSDVIGNRDVVEDGRNGFICHTAEEYVRRINQVLQDKEAGEKMAELAHQDIVSSYNTDVMADAYKKIYEGIDRRS
jgi:glycosyltransferase involved in cell wall biosynthesis